MAITIHQTPKSYTPSDNPVVWTFSSDNTDQDNFVYLVQLYVNDVTHKVYLIYPESGAVAKFDASSVASNVTKQPVLSDLVYQDAQNYAELKITVKERYGDPPVDHDSAIGTNITVFKSGMTNEDYVNWDPDDYIIGTTVKKWLTNFPTTINPRVRITGEQIRMTLIHNTNSFTMRIKTYEADGTLIANMGAFFTPSPDEKILIVNITPDVLMADFGGGDEFDDCAYYTVGSDTDFETYRIDINDDCLAPRAQRIHFLTQIGSVESFTFEALSMEKAKITGSSFQQSFGNFDGNNYEFNLEDGTDIDYAKVVTRQLMIESDWLGEDVQQWLVKNCYASPAVYQEIDGNLIRRMILQTSYAFKYHDTNMLFREKITLQLPTLKSATL